MKVLINTATTYQGGGIQVARSIIEEAVRCSNHRFVIVLSRSLERIVNRDNGGHCEFIQLHHRPAQRLQHLRNPATDLKEIEVKHKPDVVLTTSGPSYWRPMSPHVMGFNLPHFLYQDSPFFTKILGPVQRYKWMAKGFLIKYFTKRDADAWFVQTEDINHRLRNWINRDNVFTVSNTVGRVYQDHPVKESPYGRGTGVVFKLLVMSAFHRHKNLKLVDEICDLLRARKIDGIRFVMTLKDAEFTQVISERNRCYVENVGVQLPQNCPILYESTDALFLPTLLECFSASYAEAMYMNRPIVTTDLGFAKTICGNAAQYFEPLNAVDALSKILELKGCRNVYRQLVRSGQSQLHLFGTPSERFEKCLRLCESVSRKQ